MRIDYKTAAAEAWTKLGDESDRTMLLEEFTPSFTNLVQEEPLFRAPNTFKANRQNPAVALQLIVSIPYNTRAEALAAIKTLRDLFKTGSLHLRFTQDTTVHYYPNAICRGYSPRPTGVTVRHALSFTTDDVTTDEP